MTMLLAAVVFLWIAIGLGLLLQPRLRDPVAKSRRWASGGGLADLLLPAAPGLGLWLVLQFSLAYWAGLPARPWLPLALALVGWLRHLWPTAGQGRLIPASPASSAPPSSSTPSAPLASAPPLRSAVFARGWGHPAWLAGILVAHTAVLFWGTRDGLLPGIDPWGHAQAAFYIAETGSLSEPLPDLPLLHYLDAYPPGLPVLVANCAFLGARIPQTLVLVNLLTIALGLAWFHALARILFGTPGRALGATALLAAMPSFLTRHPWGHTQATCLLLAALVFLCRLATAGSAPGSGAAGSGAGPAPIDGAASGRWGPEALAAALCLAGLVLTAPSKGLKAAVLVLLFLLAAGVFLRDARRLLRLVAGAGLAAALVVCAWLGPMYQKYGSLRGVAQACEDPWRSRPICAPPLPQAAGRAYVYTPAPDRPYYRLEGTGDRELGAYDFFGFGFPDEVHQYLGLRVARYYSEGFAPMGCGGVGFTLALLGLWGLLLGRESAGLAWDGRVGRFLVAWLALSLGFTLLGVFGHALPVKLFPWRFWQLLSPFVALLAVAGWIYSCRQAARVGLQRVAVLVFLLGLGASLAWKIELNTRALTPRAFESGAEAAGYLELGTRLPDRALVFPLAGERRFQQLLGVGLGVGFWERELLEFIPRAPDCAPGELAAWLRGHRYQGVLLDSLYGVMLLERSGVLGAAPVPEEASLQLGRWVAELGGPRRPGQDPRQAVIKDRTLLFQVGALAARDQARRLLGSGAFESVLEWPGVYCLSPK